MRKRVSAEKASGMTTNAPSSTSLKNAVHRRRDQHVAAVNAGDAESAASLFDPDGIFLPPGQPALQGTSAIRARFSHVFANFRVKEFGLQTGCHRAARRHRDRARQLERDLPTEEWFTGTAGRRHLRHGICAPLGWQYPHDSRYVQRHAWMSMQRDMEAKRSATRQSRKRTNGSGTLCFRLPFAMR